MTLDYKFPFCLLFIALFFIIPPQSALAESAHWKLFGYKEREKADITMVPHWIDVLERHVREDIPEGSCSSGIFNRCHFREWMTFLDKIKYYPEHEQIDKVNAYANNKSYVLDIDNYGKSDYWAIAKQFLYNGGDCEDYAITKLLSMRMLGMDIDSTRIVVMQDTNLRIPHAILAIKRDNDILILDNQTERAVSHKDIVHYVPLYSVNENAWWIHEPL